MSYAYDFCKVCEAKIDLGWGGKEEDNYIVSDVFHGPFCNTCIFFVKELKTLNDRLTTLEKEKE